MKAFHLFSTGNFPNKKSILAYTLLEKLSKHPLLYVMLVFRGVSSHVLFSGTSFPSQPCDNYVSVIMMFSEEDIRERTLSTHCRFLQKFTDTSLWFFTLETNILLK